jgi:leucyl/phenylalanyl-tRNA--protein transferase
MQEAYIRLHREGFAHSVEVWDDGELVGGLYGVKINRVFVGESMFSRKPNASKFALITLAQRDDINLIDCQLHNPHLERMGGRFISQQQYLEILNLQ